MTILSDSTIGVLQELHGKEWIFIEEKYNNIIHDDEITKITNGSPNGFVNGPVIVFFFDEMYGCRFEDATCCDFGLGPGF